MNAEQIRQMEAGRELDTLVMEVVMGYTREEREFLPSQHWAWVKPDEKPTYLLPQFSRDMTAAWEVVEKVHSMGWFTDLCWRDDVIHGRIVWAMDFVTNAGKCVSADSESAPLAICRAALLAVMGES